MVFAALVLLSKWVSRWVSKWVSKWVPKWVSKWVPKWVPEWVMHGFQAAQSVVFLTQSVVFHEGKAADLKKT